MKDIELLKCNKCGKVIEVVNHNCCDTVCCGEPMRTLKANDTDAALEKHVPVVEINGNIVEVTVGSVLHPMTEAHLIEFIYLVTDKKTQKVTFTHTDTPKARFVLDEGEKALKVYEYCNLHGLWVAEL